MSDSLISGQEKLSKDKGNYRNKARKDNQIKIDTRMFVQQNSNIKKLSSRKNLKQYKKEKINSPVLMTYDIASLF